MPASLSAVPMSISKRKGKVRGAPAGVEPALLARAAPLIPSLACARAGRHLLGMTVARARGLSSLPARNFGASVTFMRERLRLLMVL